MNATKAPDIFSAVGDVTDMLLRKWPSESVAALKSHGVSVEGYAVPMPGHVAYGLLSMPAFEAHGWRVMVNGQIVKDFGPDGNHMPRDVSFFVAGMFHAIKRFAK